MELNIRPYEKNVLKLFFSETTEIKEMKLGLNFNTIPIGNNKLPLLSPNCIRAFHEVINRCKYIREKIVI